MSLIISLAESDVIRLNLTPFSPSLNHILLINHKCLLYNSRALLIHQGNY